MICQEMLLDFTGMGSMPTWRLTACRLDRDLICASDASV
jgi:hypothetical protein